MRTPSPPFSLTVTPSRKSSLTLTASIPWPLFGLPVTLRSASFTRQSIALGSAARFPGWTRIAGSPSVLTFFRCVAVPAPSRRTSPRETRSGLPTSKVPAGRRTTPPVGGRASRAAWIEGNRIASTVGVAPGSVPEAGWAWPSPPFINAQARAESPSAGRIRCEGFMQFAPWGWIPFMVVRAGNEAPGAVLIVAPETSFPRTSGGPTRKVGVREGPTGRSTRGGVPGELPAHGRAAFGREGRNRCHPSGDAGRPTGATEEFGQNCSPGSNGDGHD